MDEARRTVQEILNSPSEPILAFGPFKLLPLRKIMFKSDHPHVLGSRAIEILTLLVDRGGNVVSKEDLFARAWPNTHVEAINLRVHIAALRKALGDGQDGMRYIVNHPGRGYCFVAPVMRINWHGNSRSEEDAPVTPTFPVNVTPIIGRDDTLFALIDQLRKTGFVTIFGAGDLGKSTVSIDTALAISPQDERNKHVVDISARLSTPSDDPMPQLMAALQDKSTLLIFNNSEHVVGTALSLAKAVLKASHNIYVLASN
jgi:DNA-binding winged helix-turn-helix (wHTH) protein